MSSWLEDIFNVNT